MPNADAELVVYGIPNCDQVKKAIRWLEAARRPYRFHDVRVTSVGRTKLLDWFRSASWEAFVNTRSTTWRNLPAGDRPVNAEAAVAALLAHPTLMKRPVIESGGRLLVGASDADLAVFFA